MFRSLFLCLTRLVTQACILYVAEDICDNLSCTVIEMFVFSLNYIIALFHYKVKTR